MRTTMAVWGNGDWRGAGASSGVTESEDTVSFIEQSDDAEPVLGRMVDEEAENCYCGRGQTKECPICWEPMEGGRSLFTTECGHMFHFSCLQVNYQGGNVACPLCRSAFYEPPVILQDRTMSPEWFFADITREEAEDLLNSDGTDGCYLVRESRSTPGQYCLSIRHSQNWHCRIFTNEKGEYYLTTARTFKTIADLIHFYTTSCSLHSSNGFYVKLARPVTRSGRWAMPSSAPPSASHHPPPGPDTTDPPHPPVPRPRPRPNSAGPSNGSPSVSAQLLPPASMTSPPQRPSVSAGPPPHESPDPVWVPRHVPSPPPPVAPRTAPSPPPVISTPVPPPSVTPVQTSPPPFVENVGVGSPPPTHEQSIPLRALASRHTLPGTPSPVVSGTTSGLGGVSSGLGGGVGSGMGGAMPSGMGFGGVNSDMSGGGGMVNNIVGGGVASAGNMGFNPAIGVEFGPASGMLGGGVNSNTASAWDGQGIYAGMRSPPAPGPAGPGGAHVYSNYEGGPEGSYAAFEEPHLYEDGLYRQQANRQWQPPTRPPPMPVSMPPPPPALQQGPPMPPPADLSNPPSFPPPIMGSGGAGGLGYQVIGRSGLVSFADHMRSSGSMGPTPPPNGLGPPSPLESGTRHNSLPVSVAQQQAAVRPPPERRGLGARLGSLFGSSSQKTPDTGPTGQNNKSEARPQKRGMLGGVFGRKKSAPQ